MDRMVEMKPVSFYEVQGLYSDFEDIEEEEDHELLVRKDRQRYWIEPTKRSLRKSAPTRRATCQQKSDRSSSKF